MRELKFYQAIQEAIDQSMELDSRVYLMGLGVTDFAGIFGTTLGLKEKYGSKRVMDMPASENTMTGIAVGSAVMGMRPIMAHARVDFFLLGLDQLINNAAKWHFMFAGKASVPLVIRVILGRGWGQGPQHSQSLHSLFAHIPGLKVVMPSSTYDAKGLLISSIEDNNPVVFMEHRWLHNIHGDVPQEVYRVPLGKARVVCKGNELTIVTCSYTTFEVYKAIRMLEEKENVSIELIDLRSLKPLDKETILESVKKTGRLLVIDPDWKTCGFASEIVAIVVEEAFDYLKIPPARLTYPDQPCPTSWALANHYYPTPTDMVLKILEMLQKPTKSKQLIQKFLEFHSKKLLDVPDKSFTGPF